MKRLILSILAGFVTAFVLSTAIDLILHATGVFPPYGQPMFDNGLMALAFAYRAVISIFASYLTASLAREKAKKAVWILGIAGSVLWGVGAIAMWNYGPHWYSILGIFTGIPFALAGYKLYELRRQNQATQNA